jgi:hypothetical protein
MGKGSDFSGFFFFFNNYSKEVFKWLMFHI